LGFSEQVPESEIEPLRLRYLDHYRAIVADDSVLFDGLEEVLNALERRNIPWGIVTNKPKWLTTPLLEQMALDKRAAVVICGDTLDKRKPHPLPLIVAAETMGIACKDCVYIGDDPRDITAGRAAKMKTLIAAYGYIKPDTRLDEWQAGGIIEHPLELLSHHFIN
jgi:phosphoglycolate phosphatase